MTKRVLAALASMLLILLPAITPLVQLPTIQAEAIGVQYNYTMTNIVGASIAYPSITDSYVTDAIYLGDGKTIVGGTGFVASLGQGFIEEWSEATIGTVTVLSGEKPVAPSIIAAGTDRGEIVVIQLGDERKRIDYYTASGALVSQVAPVSDGRDTWIVALDDNGNMYLYKLPLTYWAQIGPAVGDGIKASLDGVGIAWFQPVERHTANTASYDPTRILALVDRGNTRLDALRGSLEANLYYIDVNDNTAKPVSVRTINGSTFVEEHRLYMYLVNDQGLLVDARELNGSTPFTISGLAATEYTVYFIYTITLTDPETGITGYSWCYSNRTDIRIVQGQTTSISLNLTYTSETLNDCLAYYNLDTLPTASLIELLYVDATGSPDNLDFIVRLFPVPEDVSIGVEPLVKIVSPSVKPQGWPLQASMVMAVASEDGNRLFVYLLTQDMTPLKMPGFQDSGAVAGGFLEQIILNNNELVTSIHVSGDARQIFVGTSNGRVIKLSWSPGLGMYVVEASMQISYTEIVGITDYNGYIVAVASDGSMQLIDQNKWIPLWRGAPPFYSMRLENTGISKLVYADPVVLLAVDTNGGIIEFQHDSRVYYPVVVNPVVALKTLDGNITQANETIAVYASVNNVDTAVSVEPPYTIYAPGEPIDIGIEVEGYGRALIRDVTPSFPYTRIDRTLYLREVSITVYVPESIGDPQSDPGYSLLAGPVGGANVTLLQSSSTSPYGYTILSQPLSGITDDDGTIRLVVWDGITYSVRVNADGFQPAHIQLPSIGPVTSNIPVDPVLYSTEFRLVDGDALDKGITVGLDGYLTLVYENGRSVSLSANGGSVTVNLPPGMYEVTGTAMHFEPTTIGVYISRNSIITVPLTPILYNVVIEPYLSLEQFNEALMPLSKSTMRIQLLEPYLGAPVQADSFDNVHLRYGKYLVSISDPYAGSYNITLMIDRDGSYSITLNPVMASASITFYDAEYPDKRVVGLVNLTLIYVYGDEWQVSTTLSVQGDKATLYIPQGYYILQAKGLGYELSTKDALIHGTTEIDFKLIPAYHDVEIRVVYADPTGIASGSVPGARITLSIISPNVGFNYSLIVGQDGVVRANIREGVYNAVVESSYTETQSYVITVLGGQITLRATPKYASMTIQAMDSEAHIIIPNFIASITRLGPGIPNTIEVTSLGDNITLNLPLGYYRVEAYIPGRYTPIPAEITLSDNMKIEVAMQPIKVNLIAVTTSANAVVSYGNLSFRLPVGLIPNTTVTLVPADPILSIVGVKPVSALTDANGTVLFSDVRPGTYELIAYREGYEKYSILVDVTYDMQSVTLQLTPKTSVWTFSIVDIDMIPGYGNLTHATLHILEYNNMPANILINYTAGTPIILSNGVYVLQPEIYGYTSEPVTLIVSSPGTAVLEVKGIRYDISVNLTAIVNNTLVPVEFGYIQAEITNLNLTNKIFMFNVTNGTAKLELRAGIYNLTYIIDQVSNYTIPLGLITVKGPDSLSLYIKPEPLEASLRIVDKELGIPLDGASVTIRYNGPFGKYERQILYTVGETSKIQILPGVVILRVEYDMYNTFEKTLVSPSKINVEMIPITTSISLTLVNPDGERLAGINVKASLKSVTLPIEYSSTTDTGLLVFTNIRVGTYRLELTPLNTTLYIPVATSIEVTRSGAQPPIITIDYNMFNVSIRLLDSELGTPVPLLYEVTIARDGEASARMGFPLTIQVAGEAFTLLPPGRYKLSISPLENDYYQYPAETRIVVPEKTTVAITMIPKKYTIEVTIVDDRGKPVEEALVTIASDQGTLASGYTDILGKFTAQLRWGTYSISVTHPDYQSTTRVIKVPDSTSVTIDMEPTLQHRIKRMAPMLLGLIGLTVMLGMAYVMRNRLIARLLEEEEYF